jgi:hypothetical protein
MRVVFYVLRFTGIFHVGPKTAARNNKDKINNDAYTGSMETDIGYGMVECRGIRNGSRDNLGVLQATFSDYTTMYARTHTRTMLKVYYCVYKDSSCAPSLSQMNPIEAFTSYIRDVCLNIIILYT